MAQALSCQSVSEEAWVRSSVRLREFCGEQSGTWIYFSPSASDLLQSNSVFVNRGALD